MLKGVHLTVFNVKLVKQQAQLTFLPALLLLSSESTIMWM
jgi:hypothetical protein